MSTWTCYTDGGCHGNPGPCAWGAVVVAPDGTAAEGSGFLGHGTNQIAELSAALHGIAMTPPGAEVLLVSDSQYTLKGLTEWRRGWESKGFRNSKGETVANLAIWKLLYAAADQRRVRTQWVKGHSGHAHNERCDVLAGLAIRNSGGTASRPVAAPVQAQLALEPVALPATTARAAAAQRAAMPGLTWTPVTVPGPADQTLLFGLVEPSAAGPRLVRVETCSRDGLAPGAAWASHWMLVPAYVGG